MAGVEDQVSLIVGDLGIGGCGVNFVGIRALIPDNFNSVADDQFGEVVKRIELTESGRPVEITPTVSGQDNRQLITFGGTKIGNAPNTSFKDCFPVGAFVNGAFDANFVDNEAVIFGEGRVDVGEFGRRIRY